MGECCWVLSPCPGAGLRSVLSVQCRAGAASGEEPLAAQRSEWRQWGWIACSFLHPGPKVSLVQRRTCLSDLLEGLGNPCWERVMFARFLFQKGACVMFHAAIKSLMLPEQRSLKGGYEHRC